MSSRVLALPRLIELRSLDNTILRYVKEEGKLKGLVQFHGENLRSSEAKFEVHSSENGNGLVHIRSCYNNKYLVVNQDNWITAEAEKPEEDQSKLSCTLLRPIFVDGNPKKIQLFHVHLEMNLIFWGAVDKPYYGCVAAKSPPQDTFCSPLFTVIDWQSLVFLPKYVAFMSDNNHFLRTIWFRNQTHLQFSEADMEDDPMSVGNEIMETSNGNICLRNLESNKYWTLLPEWIVADSTNPGSDGTVFEPVRISDNTIALRSVANNLFCKRLTGDGRNNCLSASTRSMNSLTRLKVSELVISRKVENVKFRLMDARIYNKSVIMMDSSSIINHGSGTQTQAFHLSYKKKTSKTWSSKVSLKVSIETSVSAGIPEIIEGEISLGVEIAGEYTWGETTEEEEEKSETFTFTIPPKTKTTVRLMATRGTCDVPFSYTQRDVLYTGETVVTEMDDGVYTGANNDSYHTEVKEEPLQIKDPHMKVTGFKKVAKISPITGVITPI